MLGISDEKTLDEIWQKLDSKAALVTDLDEFLSKSGMKSAIETRDYMRYYFRCRGIIQSEAKYHGVFMRDCSRSGMGFFSPIQLFPREHIQLWTDRKRCYQLEITRCRRIQANCYKCGAIYLLHGF